jgi:transcriptional regulator with XRE-family HTH domain
MEEPKCSLKTRLHEAMAARGKKAVDLTRDLHIPKSAISQYLSGKSQNMDSERLYKIAYYLDVSEPWLLGYDVPMGRTTPEDLGAVAADVLLNPKLLRLTQIFLELDQADQDMLSMLAENMHQKTKKG